MCGPADFDALRTCATRLAELSAAGLTTYSVYKTASIYRDFCKKLREWVKDGRQRLPAGLAADTSSAHPNR